MQNNINTIKNSDLDLKRQMRKMYANANVILRNLVCFVAHIP